jgi:hypothetical protein
MWLERKLHMLYSVLFNVSLSALSKELLKIYLTDMPFYTSGFFLTPNISKTTDRS